jgi:hypothetical protein
MAMLTAYLDESYNHFNQKKPDEPLIYTVDCLVSTTDKWKKFGKQWRAALKSAELDGFHMSEFENHKGQYANWSNLKRVAFFKRLKRIIKSNVLYGVSLSLHCAAYDELVTGEVRKEMGKTHYGFDVRMIITHLSQWADENSYHNPIHYVFAELGKQGGELDKIFKDCLKDPETKKQFRLNGMWTKGTMRDVVQLQAADIIAYEMNKRAVNDLGTDRKVRKSLDSLRLDRDFAPLYFGRNELLKWMLLPAKK